MDSHEPSPAPFAIASGPPPAPAQGSPAKKIRIARPAPRPHGLAMLLFGLTSFLVVFLVGAFATPWLVARWRAIEIRSEADAAYARRRAELRAEAEAAEERLQLLDKRVNLISLGFRDVVRKVGPIVVNLTSLARERDPNDKDSKDWPPVPDPDHPGQVLYLVSHGSGFIVEPNWILTNNHVVTHAHRLRVTFSSGYTIAVGAERIKIDPLTDLAAVFLPASPPGVLRDDDTLKVEFANSDAVERGDLVLALGNPLGLKHTVTHGIISAKGRLIHKDNVSELLQTDTQINRGNSGGPLFDHLGRLVGVNCAIVTESGYHQGIGFAIPSNTAKEVFRQLKEKGEVERGYLGAGLVDLDAAEAKALGLERAGGVLIRTAEKDQAAWNAGLRAGDVIIKYNGEPFSGNNPRRHLWQLIMETKPGAHVPVVYVRDGEWATVAVTVGKRPPEPKKRR